MSKSGKDEMSINNIPYKKLILLNYSVVLLQAICFPIGLFSDLIWVPVSLLVFIHLNYINARSVRELAILNCNMIAAIVASMIVNAGLYFIFVFYDGLGFLLSAIFVGIALFVATLCALVGVIVKIESASPEGICDEQKNLLLTGNQEIAVSKSATAFKKFSDFLWSLKYWLLPVAASALCILFEIAGRIYSARTGNNSLTTWSPIRYAVILLWVLSFFWRVVSLFSAIFQKKWKIMVALLIVHYLYEWTFVLSQILVRGT